MKKIDVHAEYKEKAEKAAKDYQEISGTTSKEWMKLGVDTVDKYNQCAIQVDAWIKIGEELKKP